MQQKGKRLKDLWKSNFSKEAITKTFQAVKKSAIVTKARNVLDPENIKAVMAKTYDDVIKEPATKTWKWMKDHVFNVKVLNGFQMGLDVAGAFPGFGEIADGINGLIYTARGDKVNAALSYSAMVPIVGSAGTAGKWINKASNAVDDVSDVAGKTKKSVNANRLNFEDITSEVLKTKPMNSPKPDKWYKKNGSISIDDNGTWTYTNKSEVSVSYPNGYPDFTPFMHPNVKPVQIEIHSPKNNPKDFENANKEAKLSEDTDPPIIDIRRPPDGYTWHHHEDGRTMMLVDEDIHREFRHIGGQSKVNGKNK